MTNLAPDATNAPGVVLSGAAPPIPPLEPGEPPLAILVDYDGTIALTDVSDTVMAEHVSHADWERIAAIYDAGRMGSRRLMEWEVTLIQATEAELLATAAVQPHDPGFVPFARRASSAGIPVEVVSDGFGFFIGPALARLGLAELPIVTARTTFGPGGPGSTGPTATPIARSAGPASASGSWPTRPPAGRSCSSVMARAIATPPAMPT